MARRFTPEDDIKDFVVYRSRARFNIKPQTARGWWMMMGWTILLLAPTVPLVMLAARVDDTPQEKWLLFATVPHLLVTGLIAWLMIRWALARAETLRQDEAGNWVREDELNAPVRGRQRGDG